MIVRVVYNLGQHLPATQSGVVLPSFTWHSSFKLLSFDYFCVVSTIVMPQNIKIKIIFKTRKSNFILV